MLFPKAKPQRGEIIVFPYPKDPSKDFVKRLVGLGGDIIEIRDKQLYIDKVLYVENYTINKDPKTIPALKFPKENNEYHLNFDDPYLKVQ